MPSLTSSPSDSTIGWWTFTIIVGIWAYWMVWLLLVPFIDENHPLMILYPLAKTSYDDNKNLMSIFQFPEILLPVTGVQVLITIATAWIVILVLKQR
jgi:hypothetical protein